MLKAGAQTPSGAPDSQEPNAPAAPAAAPSAAVPASHPDAALIAASAEYIDLEKRIADMPEPGGRSSSAAHAAWSEATEPLYSRQAKLRDFMADTRATTLDGLRAKAAALRTWLPVTATGDDLYGTEHGLTWSLVQDVLALRRSAP